MVTPGSQTVDARLSLTSRVYSVVLVFCCFFFRAFEAARCSVCPDLLKCAVLFYLSTYFIFLIKIRMISCSVMMLRAHSPVLCTEACWQRAAHKHSLNLHFIQAFPFNYRDQLIFIFLFIYFLFTPDASSLSTARNDCGL